MSKVVSNNRYFKFDDDTINTIDCNTANANYPIVNTYKPTTL